MRLEGCAFSDNNQSTLPTLLADNRQADGPNEVIFYSDNHDPSVRTYEGDSRNTEPPACETSFPLRLDRAAGDFLSTSSDSFTELKEVRLCAVNTVDAVALQMRWGPAWCMVLPDRTQTDKKPAEHHASAV